MTTPTLRSDLLEALDHLKSLEDLNYRTGCIAPSYYGALVKAQTAIRRRLDTMPDRRRVKEASK